MVPVSTPFKNGRGMLFMTESYGKTENTFCCNAKEIKSTLLVQYLPDDQQKFLCT